MTYCCSHAGILFNGTAASKECNEKYYSTDDYEQIRYVKVFVIQKGIEFMVIGFGADSN